jgi:AraC-like DNA-binding protein
MLDFDWKQGAHSDATCAPRAARKEYSLPRPVRRGIEYIHANLSEEVRLEDIAGAAGLSTFHFARLFRQATGMAPHRYVVQVRVGKVKELLGEGELCLAAIADEAGFADQSHMSRVFKRLMGMTPKTFRRDRRLRSAPPRESFELVRSRVRRLT